LDRIGQSYFNIVPANSGGNMNMFGNLLSSLFGGEGLPTQSSGSRRPIQNS